MNLTIPNSSVRLKMHSMLSHDEWNVIHSKAHIKYSASYPEAVITFTLRRRPVRHLVETALPCVILGLVTLGAFLLPPCSHERLVMSLGSMLGHIVLLHYAPVKTIMSKLSKMIMYFAILYCFACDCFLMRVTIVLTKFETVQLFNYHFGHILCQCMSWGNGTTMLCTYMQAVYHATNENSARMALVRCLV